MTIPQRFLVYSCFISVNWTRARDVIRSHSVTQFGKTQSGDFIVNTTNEESHLLIFLINHIYVVKFTLLDKNDLYTYFYT